MTPDEVVRRIGPASGIAERIARHDWIGQAEKLADKSNMAFQDSGEPKRGGVLHAMNYMIELFLDEFNYVSRTRIHHVQSDEEEPWDGWDEAKLIAFFKRRPELNLVKPTQAPPPPTLTHSPQSARFKAKTDQATTSKSASVVISGTEAVESQSKLRLQKVEIFPAQSKFPSRSLDHNQAFDVRLYFDLAEVKALGQETFNYTATVLTKSLGAPRRQTYVKYQGAITPANSMTLNMKGPTLEPGIYRITAALTLSPKVQDATPKSDLTASLESSLFEVY
jgi:hypothetical protein